MTDENHLCVLFDHQSDRILYADKEGDEVNNKTTESAKVRVQSGLNAPFAPSYKSEAETIEVVALPIPWATIPNNIITRWPRGSLLQVSSAIGFITHADAASPDLTLALRLEYRT